VFFRFPVPTAAARAAGWLGLRSKTGSGKKKMLKKEKKKSDRSPDDDADRDRAISGF
jgi:hypothetical protein